MQIIKKFSAKFFGFCRDAYKSGHPGKKYTYKIHSKSYMREGAPSMNEPYTSRENWKDINDFPGYSVSDWGNVMNKDTGFHLRPSLNTRGLPMVGLMRNKVQNKRALTVLVARAFVPKPRAEFDTPINLDGDRMNNYATNIVWRPLWFARKYMKQFIDNHLTYNEPIEDIETGETYKNSMHAATVHGLLDAEIVLSMHNNTYVWPTGQIFRDYIER